MVEKLLRCTKCDQIIPHPASFGDSIKSSLLPGVEWSAADLERQKEFFRCHAAHPVEELRVITDTFVSNKPSWEAVKVGYFQATNGQKKFLIKRIKWGLDSPAVYELISGIMPTKGVIRRIRRKLYHRANFVLTS